MVQAFFWMTHGHRPQQQALLSVKRAFGDRIGTVGSRIDGRLDLVPADLALDEPSDGTSFVDFVRSHAERLRETAGPVPVIVLAMNRRRDLLARADELRASGIVLLAGSRLPETIDLCEDKFLFAEFMRENFSDHALPTEFVTDVDALDAAIAKIEASGHEVCVKPPIGVFGMGFWHLSRRTPVSAMFAGSSAFEEWRKVNPSLFRMGYASDPKPLVVMPFLAGMEISIDALFRNGELLRAATRRKNGSLQAVAEDGDEVLPVLRQIGRALSLDGIVNVQVRRASEARPNPYKVLEINTRYAGGSAYLIEAGVDLFCEAVCSVLGMVPTRRPLVPLLDVAVRAEPARPESRWSVNA